LTELGFKVLRQVLLPIQYDELYIKDAYKIDLLVEDKLVLELKSLYPLPPVYFNQIPPYFITKPETRQADKF
jgi:GxxExxY protein